MSATRDVFYRRLAETNSNETYVQYLIQYWDSKQRAKILEAVKSDVIDLYLGGFLQTHYSVSSSITTTTQVSFTSSPTSSPTPLPTKFPTRAPVDTGQHTLLDITF